MSRKRGVQLALIDALCEYGANPNTAAHATALHGDLEALETLIRHGARMDLPVAAALGHVEDARRLLETSSGEERHLALSLAADFGHVQIVRLLLDAGENPNRYNPVEVIRMPHHCIKQPEGVTKTLCGCSSSAGPERT